MTTKIPEKKSNFLWSSVSNWLSQDAPNLPQDLLASIERLYQEMEKGGICIPVNMATAKTWLETGWVGKEGDFCPFILSEAGNLYLARYADHEVTVANELIRRANIQIEPENKDKITPIINKLFPGKDTEDKQRLAVLLAPFKSLIFVSGGPGTGKTTTVVKMLALLQSLAGKKPLDIQLAAPTGKAAQRLSESIREKRDDPGIDPQIRLTIPDQAKTLHRLLGAQGDTGRFNHHEQNPLLCDVLLIDEASMIDLAMLSAILKATPPEAKLIFLGDKDQLDAVEAGSVFGDLCAAQGMSKTLLKMLKPFGIPSDISAAKGVLADCRVELTKSYRFTQDSIVGNLAQAAKQQDDATFNAKIDTAQCRVQEKQLAAFIKKSYQFYLQLAQQPFTPEVAAQVFVAFNNFRVLCAHRSGPLGVEGINALMQSEGEWQIGRPIIIRSNDYAVGLFNGDIGLYLNTDNGPRIIFESALGHYRHMTPGRLPRYESAWAMTVHQSQGSEFKEILLVLPNELTQVVNRSLIYTAVTRAKAEVKVCGTEAVIAQGLKQIPTRRSGLAARLGVVAS